MLSGEALSPLEVACGFPLGGEPVALDRDPRPPAAALEDAILPALAGRALVAFSGGRDSAVVLAAAARAARRHGLEPPVPVTIRLPHVASSHEDEWQERVVGHLGLDDWVRLEIAGELELLGPVAREVLARHGAYWPANAHFLTPMLREARGGTLLLGDGGDELFGLWRGRAVADVLAGRVRPRPRHLRALAGALAPARVPRPRAARRAARAELPWLTEAGLAAYREALARESRGSWRWDRHLGRAAGSRFVTLATATFETLAADAGARVQAPLLDQGFLGALAAAGGARGLGGRTQAMVALFGELLPADVLARRGKATFNLAYFGDRTRAFAREWDGRGSPLVDAQALRAAWLAPVPHWQSADLLQRAVLEMV